MMKMVDGVLVEMTPEEVAAREAEESAWAQGAPARAAVVARIALDDSEQIDCKLDSGIVSLLNQTRAEWQAWAGGNFPSLTTAEKNRLGTLFWVVAIGVRRMIRNG
jgi:hypothetical protein